MPIVKAELKFMKSLVVSDSTSNGGRMSAVAVVSGAASNLFPVVGETERDDGSVKYRKLFGKVANDGDLPLYSGKVFIDQHTAADDIIVFFEATQTDTQNTVTGSERVYGAGALDSSVSEGATEIDVLVEDADLDIFQDGDLIRVSDKTSILDLVGVEEFVTIDGTPTVLGNVVTIVFTPALVNPYLSSATRVATVLEVGNIEATVDSLVVTTAGSGDFDADNLLPDAIGGIEQIWTLTFTSPTAFNIVGDSLGAIGAGNVGSGASPNNASFSKPYFVLQSAGFSGVYAAADTIVFATHPAATPIWMKRIVPAGAATFLANLARIVLTGETAG